MKKTLGGDRLGAGKKMEVTLHGYERSTHDIGYLWRSTMAAGTLVPFMSEVATPGTTFDINLDCDIKTHPTIGPLFGSYKVQLDIFLCPIRLYQGQLHNNKLGIGRNMAQVKLPLIELNATVFNPEDVPDIDNAQINPSAILSYLGIRGVGLNVPIYAAEPRQFNAVPLLAYWDIYKNYYANKQEEIGAVIHTPQAAIIPVDEVRATAFYGGIPSEVTVEPQGGPAGQDAPLNTGGWIDLLYSGAVPDPSQTMLNLADGRRYSAAELGTGQTQLIGGLNPLLRVFYDANKWGIIWLRSWQAIQPSELPQQEPQVTTFPLENIDTMREEILAAVQSPTAFIVNDANLTPYSYILGATSGFNHMLSTQEGLGLKTYQSDLFNNWLQTDWIDGAGGISEITAIDTSSLSFTIDQLILSKKVYDMLNRIAVSGGSYDDWIDAVYTHDRTLRAESPMYMGGLIKELVFQEVISNSQSGEGGDTPQPLGTLAGRGVMAQKHKGGNVRVAVDEPAYVLGIISLTPRIDYSQGNKWDVHLKTMDDLHKPALDEIGFQELVTEQMAWWSTGRLVGGTDQFITKSAGKQPAWLNYMTNVNQTRGNFAIRDNEMFMTLNRRYEADPLLPEIVDLTTYIDPVKFNHIFAETARDAQNFWVQVAVDITARRKMSGKLMPNL